MTGHLFWEKQRKRCIRGAEKEWRGARATPWHGRLATVYIHTHSRANGSRLLSTLSTHNFALRLYQDGSRTCQLNNQTRHQSNDLAVFS